VKTATEISQKVNVDKKSICNYGRACYLDTGNAGLKQVTDDFQAYFTFIKKWGTVSKNSCMILHEVHSAS